jgi:hypothetical protein
MFRFKTIVFNKNTTGYNYKSDVYSLGTVACELANGSNTYVDMPFGNLSVRDSFIYDIDLVCRRYLDALC